MDVQIAAVEQPQQLLLAVEAHDGRMGQARAQPAVFLFLGPLAGEHQLDFVGVPALFRRLDNEILPFLPGQAAHHQDDEFALEFRGARGVHRAEQGIHPVGDDPHFGVVAVGLQLPRDELAWAVDVAEAVVKFPVAPVVKKVVEPFAFSHADAVGDVFGLHVEGGHGGHAHLPGDFLPPAAKAEGQVEMHHVGVPEGLVIRLLVRLGEAEALLFDQGLKHRNFMHRRADLPLSRFSPCQNGDAMASPPQLLGVAPGGDGGAVVAVVELVDDQHDVHKAPAFLWW